jgi:hypothetical protein
VVRAKRPRGIDATSPETFPPEWKLLSLLTSGLFIDGFWIAV